MAGPGQVQWRDTGATGHDVGSLIGSVLDFAGDLRTTLWFRRFRPNIFCTPAEVSARDSGDHVTRSDLDDHQTRDTTLSDTFFQASRFTSS
jgi:hypothetical protein